MKDKKERLKHVAYETLEILNEGSYVNKQGEWVQLKDAVQHAVNNSVMYKPKDIARTLSEQKEMVVQVTNETTLSAAKRLSSEWERVVVLNFASAKNPGGGFLKGSSAQEESLARSSALYPTLLKHKEMYEYNRKSGTCLYSDHMIFSPDVPVFRDDFGRLLDNPYGVSFITSPAVNAGVVRNRESGEAQNMIHSAMQRRIDKILSVASSHDAEAIVLGAFGCGVFQNNPEDVANYFKEALSKNQSFKKVVFAIYDPNEKQEVYKTFKSVL